MLQVTTRTAITTSHVSAASFVDELLKLREDQIDALRLVVLLSRGPSATDRWQISSATSHEGETFHFASKELTVFGTPEQFRERYETLAALGLVEFRAPNDECALILSPFLAISPTPFAAELVDGTILERVANLKKTIERTLQSLTPARM